MNSTYNPLREVPTGKSFRPGDYLVVIGEIFQRGYANGLIDQAKRQGMNVIYTTVGRRDKEGRLRPLNAEEVPLGCDLINIPLEAGFDLEPDKNGSTPVDQLKDIKLNNWESTPLNWGAIEDSQNKAKIRFKNNLELVFKELEKKVPKDKNVLFAHIMAGGVPRAKIIMPLMNRVFKGVGDRYLSSKTFWESELGRLCSKNFLEVTAETYQHLFEIAIPFAQRQKEHGHHVSFLAYGYHGTEILTENNYEWQSYAPYLQGWAKIKLEQISKSFHEKGFSTCVYNCPEILTNSSSIFQGVEIPLYPLLLALKKESPTSEKTKHLFALCQDKLKSEARLEDLAAITKTFYKSYPIQGLSQLDAWPQHSSKEQLESLLSHSDQLISLHKDPKDLVTFPLSEVVFECCGYIMLKNNWQPTQSVAWIGHDIIAKTYPQLD